MRRLLGLAAAPLPLRCWLLNHTTAVRYESDHCPEPIYTQDPREPVVTIVREYRDPRFLRWGLTHRILEPILFMSCHVNVELKSGLRRNLCHWPTGSVCQA